MPLPITSYEAFQRTISESAAVLVYFSQPGCGVCTALEPKIRQLVATAFPRLHFVSVDLTQNPAVRGQLQIFSVPTICVYFGGQESFRASRNVSIGGLRSAIARHYDIYFENGDDSVT